MFGCPWRTNFPYHEEVESCPETIGDDGGDRDASSWEGQDRRSLPTVGFERIG